MKKTSAELKRFAREHLTGHYALLIGASLVAGLIVSAILTPFQILFQLNPTPGNFAVNQIATFIIRLLSTVLSGGLLRMHLKLAALQQPVFSDLFYYFTHRPDRFILSAFLVSILYTVCVIPGIVCAALAAFFQNTPLMLISILLSLAASIAIIFLSLSFSLFFILLADDDSMGSIEALRTSRRLMRHNKGRFFYIQLSFIGWILLGILSCFIGYLWLAPYMNQVTIEFYHDVTGSCGNAPDNAAYEPQADTSL